MQRRDPKLWRGGWEALPLSSLSPGPAGTTNVQTKGNSQETMPLLFATRRPDCTEKQEIVKIVSVLFFRSWSFRFDMLHALKTQQKSETVST